MIENSRLKFLKPQNSFLTKNTSKDLNKLISNPSITPKK